MYVHTDVDTSPPELGELLDGVDLGSYISKCAHIRSPRSH